MKAFNHITKSYRLWLIGTVLLGASLACNLLKSPTPLASPIPVTTEAAERLVDKASDALSEGEADQSFSLEVTEAEFTSLIAFELMKQQDPILQDPQVFFRQGEIQVFGKIDQGGLRTEARLVFSAEVDSQGQPVVELVSANLGPLPVPDSVIARISSFVDQSIKNNLESFASDIILEQITISEGILKIEGEVR